MSEANDYLDELSKHAEAQIDEAISNQDAFSFEAWSRVISLLMRYREQKAL